MDIEYALVCLRTAEAELRASGLLESADAMDALRGTLAGLDEGLTHSGRLSRMAMLKAVEAELKSERQFYVEIMLAAKRQVTGSGTAGLIMDIVQVALVIAATAASGGAAIGLAVGASVTGSARKNENLFDAALGASAAAETKKSYQDAGKATTVSGLGGAVTPSDHHKGNVYAKSALTLTQLSGSRIQALKASVEQMKKWYDWTSMEPSVGTGAYKLTQLKRKTTAWVHHGEGGTYAIEHDFTVAIGLAYADFLNELGQNKHGALLKDAEDEQSAFSAHKITKHILNKACHIYRSALSGGGAAYKALMTQRGNQTFGYDGPKALEYVRTSVAVLYDGTRDLRDFAEVKPEILRRLNM